MSVACLLDEPMAKAKRNDRVVKVDAGVVEWAELIALKRKQTLAEYVSEALRPIVERDYQEVAKVISEEAKPTPKPPKR